MPTHHVYTNATFPLHLAHQRQAFIRLYWVDDYTTHPPDTLTLDPRSVRHDLYVQNDALVSAISVIKTTLTLNDQAFVCYGIAAMMTFTFWRKQGYGSDLCDRATAFIRAQADADVGLLWTSVPDFYRARGWEGVPGEPAVYGNPAKPTVRGGEVTMMLFLSERAQAARPQLEAGPLYVGQTSW